MISPQYVDGLELRIKELTHARDELSARLKTSRRDYEVMNKFREGAEAERDAAIKSAELLEAELQNRAVNDGDAIASDIYFYCIELLEPHNFTGHPRELNGREDEYLPCSVGESMKFLIDFWMESRPKLREMEEVRVERDALAAHVEMLESIINSSDLTDRPHVMSALNSLPETSLAKLIAEKQAEALDELMVLIGAGATPDEVSDWLVTGANRLRRQAGGDV